MLFFNFPHFHVMTSHKGQRTSSSVRMRSSPHQNRLHGNQQQKRHSNGVQNRSFLHPNTVGKSPYSSGVSLQGKTPQSSKRLSSRFGNGENPTSFYGNKRNSVTSLASNQGNEFACWNFNLLFYFLGSDKWLWFLLGILVCTFLINLLC